MIKYLGSKRTLIPRILEVVAAIDAARVIDGGEGGRVRSVIDLLPLTETGTSPAICCRSSSRR